MGFSDAIKTCLAKYADFSGRAMRSEFWYFTLFAVLLQVGLDIILNIIVGGNSRLPAYVSGIAGLVLIIPSLAAGARRLHDIDKSGWWQLFYLLPVIGWIPLIYFWCQRGTEGANRFGG